MLINMHYWYGTFFAARSGNFSTTSAKNIEWVCTKLFPGAKSHGHG